MTRDLEKSRVWKTRKSELQFLNALFIYNHETAWKQARKQGNVNWLDDEENYKQWRQDLVSSTLWCTGILGSGKAVLSANLVEDLKLNMPAAVAYFFCRYDEVQSLQSRTIIGSLARQIFDHVKPDVTDTVTEMKAGILVADQILDYLQELLSENSQKYIIIVDGLDEC